MKGLDILNEYQLIHYSDLYKGDTVAYFKTREFWNIKLIKRKGCWTKPRWTILGKVKWK